MRSRAFASVIWVVVTCAIHGAAEAQDRLPPIPLSQMTAEQKKAADDFKVARKVELSGPFFPLLRSPEVMTRTRAMGDYLRYGSALPPRLSEFVILLTARQWGQGYEWGVHQPIALSAGVSAETVNAIADGRRPPALTADEAILYDVCDELQRTRGISDPTYSRLVSRFGEKGVIDTVGIVGYYSMLAMFLNTSRTPVDQGAPLLKPLP